MTTQAIDQYGRPVESEFITASTLSAVTTLQNAAVATGVGTALPTNGYGVASIAISGTFNATITFEGQGPDGNWYQVNGRLRGGGSPAPTTTTTGLYEVNCMGLTAVRSNITGYTSGSVTVKGVAQPLSPTSDVMSLTGSYLLNSLTQAGDAWGGSAPNLLTSGQSYDFNGGSYDRRRNNTQGTLLASAARTASAFAPNTTNYNARSLQIILDVTAASGTGGLTVQIAGLTLSGKVFQMNVNPTAVTATGRYVYEIGPGLTGSGVTQRTQGSVPRVFTVTVGHGDSSSYTYSLEYNLNL